MFAIRWQWADETSCHQEATELRATHLNDSAFQRLKIAKEDALLAERKAGIPWQTVVDRYLAEELVHQKPRSKDKWVSATNWLKALCKPIVLSDVDGDLLSKFAAKLRTKDKPVGAETIRGYLRELGRMLRWAEGIWTDYQMPRIRPPKGVKRAGMKGRPITREEFERMLTATEGVVGADYAELWRYYLTGLYLSGLRLAESLELSWDDWRTMHVLSLDLDAPSIQLAAKFDKAGSDDSLPITTDFAWFLDETPARQRKGRVFKLALTRGHPCYWTVGKTVEAIGKAAAVMVFAGKADKIKWASAHDLRRAFGTRWAPHMMPADLQRYMRHRSIQTTMKYYVDLDLKKAGKRTRDSSDQFAMIDAARELLHYHPETKHVT